MSIIAFPRRVPASHQLELPRAQLTNLLSELSAELMQRQLELIKASNAEEFAMAVHKASAKLNEVGAAWADLSDTIRDGWRI